APPTEAVAAPRPAEGRTEQGVRVHARQVTIPSTRGPVTITVAAPRSVVARPIRAALIPLLAMLAGLGVLLAATSLIQLRLGLRPLRRLRDEVAAIRSGERTRVEEDQPAELQPLAVELNALTVDTERNLAAARTAAANLAHALKTPVATLALDLANDPPRAAQVARIDATIRHHLARARTQIGATRAVTPLAPAMDDLAHAIGRLHADRGIAVTTDIAADLTVAMDAQDLDEVAGNLVDNAARHARSRVTIGAATEGRQILLRVVDDGPGIAEEDRLRATQAGARLDERGDGHGFGLPIVRELAEFHGGGLILAEAAGGGLSATVLLPRAARQG
ncbi:sensor histidine kinase, partial [Sphingomonas sp. 2378]|uniref:sensor histidine kinase n=1 Tax=Sphingomonas sp. 2378 TaxID=1219748 RepID=UPI00311AEDEB